MRQRRLLPGADAETNGACELEDFLAGVPVRDWKRVRTVDQRPVIEPSTSRYEQAMQLAQEPREIDRHLVNEPRGDDGVEGALRKGRVCAIRQEELERFFAKRPRRRGQYPAAADGIYFRRIDARFSETHAGAADDRFSDSQQIGVNVDHCG